MTLATTSETKYDEVSFMSAKKDSRYSEKTAGYCFTYYLDLESLVDIDGWAGLVCQTVCSEIFHSWRADGWLGKRQQTSALLPWRFHCDVAPPLSSVSPPSPLGRVSDSLEISMSSGSALGVEPLL